jgi:hypothetical protein
MSDFDSLTKAIEGWFDTKLHDLPDVVRQRVVRDFVPMPWDSLSADERRSVALQLDYQHDPATERERQHAWDRHVRMDEIRKKIAEWAQVTAPIASDLSIKESRLAKLHDELSQLEAEERIAGRSTLVSPTGQVAPRKSTSGKKYIPYLVAQKLLTERIGATLDELAGWIWLGPNDGGIAAYLNANELDPPPRFFYSVPEGQGHDYLAPLMACWFREDDVVNFEPTDRFITGRALIERWSKHPAIRPEAYIRAKIRELSLVDIHPIFGGTQGTFSSEDFFPPIEAGLFVLSDVEEIEASEFCDEAVINVSARPERTVEPALGSAEWRRRIARDAANVRHNQPGGSREKHQQLRDLWASGKYASRDRCAEEECAALGMSFAAARRALRNTPDPQRT